jgi:hypothetical protein
VLGAVAAGRFPTVLAAMNAMNEAGRVIAPVRGRVSAYYDRTYRFFHQLHATSLLLGGSRPVDKIGARQFAVLSMLFAPTGILFVHTRWLI